MARYVEALERYRGGRLSCVAAAELLGISERHFRRLRDRYEAAGAEGLIDRRRGRASGRRAPVDRIEFVVEQYRTRYWDFTVKHFHEALQAEHGFRLSYTWTKTVLQSRGLVAIAPRRSAHRKKRPRRPLPGMMLFQDGSPHEWLVGQAPLDLIVTLDDATSAIYSIFLVEAEGTASSFRGLAEVISRHGLFSSLYTDRGSHYFTTPKAGGKVDRQQPTQVGRALAELSIEHIPSYSPEARGRMERVFGTLQQRLPPLLRLNGITTIAAANQYIWRTPTGANTTRALPLPRPSRAAPLCRLPPACGTFCASSTSASSDATIACAMKGGCYRSPSSATVGTSSRSASRCTNIPTARLHYSTARGGLPSIPRKAPSLPRRSKSGQPLKPARRQAPWICG